MQQLMNFMLSISRILSRGSEFPHIRDAKKTKTGLSYLLTASFSALPALNTGALDAGMSITSSGFLGFLP
jgi:hypothetical protein